ncbi:hypothetical protein PIB30_013617 [Stylosanthes scabra]|uniref:Carbonic anhydrase n=1 Tax=Stylosanthes scabra TaxID=79078 RepID=A0ABU6U854_9FABA|nr:hypothetical protein [Stylosanthes scabra]
MMKHQSRIKILVILVTIFLISSISWTSAEEEVEDEREFDYIKGSEKGPSHWGDLKKEWKACNNGEMQSPIDLTNKRVRVVPNLGVLTKNYKPQNASIVNRGHDISVRWNGDAGSISINGTQLFLLKQCHWHSPSEHTINGIRYDMELHMVHESPKTNKVAVLGLLFKIGRPNPTLSKLSNYIKSLVDKEEEERKIGVFDPSKIKLGGKKYYRYMGSLTVPPCTEGVIWTINKKVRTVSREQIKLLREAVHDHAEKNARPTQPLNEREIQFYNAKRKE